VYSTPCSGCDSSSPAYVGTPGSVPCNIYCPSCSSTPNACEFYDQYLDGTELSGYVTTAVLAVGPFSGINVEIGAIIESTPFVDVR
jgi:hypothetical protein